MDATRVIDGMAFEQRATDQFLCLSTSGRQYTLSGRPIPDEYDVLVWSCDCMAGRYGRDCKHVDGLFALFNRLPTVAAYRAAREARRERAVQRDREAQEQRTARAAALMAKILRLETRFPGVAVLWIYLGPHSGYAEWRARVSGDGRFVSECDRYPIYDRDIRKSPPPGFPSDFRQHLVLPGSDARDDDDFGHPWVGVAADPAPPYIYRTAHTGTREDLIAAFPAVWAAWESGPG